MNPAYHTTRFLVPSEEMDRVPETFAVVTPCNPGGQAVAEVENRHRLQQLEQVLREKKLRYFPATGTSPDGTHAEPGFGIACPLSEALALGRRFGQEAIYWIHRDSLELVAIAGSPGERLGSWHARVLPAQRD